VSRKKFAKMTAPSRMPTMFAAVSVRIRKMRNGTSGLPTRSSVATKAARRAPATTSSPIVRAVAQPTSGAFEIE
jgi:hypothetical protein